MKRFYAFLLAIILSLSYIAALAAVKIPDEIPVGVVNASAKLYKKASTKDGTVTTLKAGTEIEIISESKSYYRVVLDNRAGYVLKKHITLAGAEKPAGSPVTTVVKNKEMTLFMQLYGADGKTLEDRELTGTYSGDVINGIPNGTGKFQSMNAEGVAWTYNGKFKDGKFHGKGKTVWDSGYSEEGTYTDGRFTPTPKEMLVHISKYAGYSEFGVSATTQKFLDRHANLFPAKTQDDVSQARKYLDKDIKHRHLSKSMDPHLETIVDLNNVLIQQIFEEKMFGHTITSILLSDQDSNYYVVYYDGAIEKYTGDRVSLYALPIDSSSFKNIGGGSTNHIVVYGCAFYG